MRCKDCNKELPVRTGRGRRPVRCVECQQCHRRTSDTASKRLKYATDTTFAEKERRRAGQAIGHLFLHATK